MRFHFDHPALGVERPGLYFGPHRVLPIAAPHGYNEKRDDVLFQMPNWLRTLGLYAEPDFIVGGRLTPYLRRWWLLPRNRWVGAYLHEFKRSDDDRALHDHPWDNCSIVVTGSYIEEMPDLAQLRTPFTRIYDLPRIRVRRDPGAIVFRRATDSHRIELINEQPVRTIFLTSRITRGWGFHCAQGWIPWQEFVGADPGEVGKGCGEGSPGMHTI
jgi:hypothetical protein